MHFGVILLIRIQIKIIIIIITRWRRHFTPPTAALAVERWSPLGAVRWQGRSARGTRSSSGLLEWMVVLGVSISVLNMFQKCKIDYEISSFLNKSFWIFSSVIIFSSSTLGTSTLYRHAWFSNTYNSLFSFSKTYFQLKWGYLAQNLLQSVCWKMIRNIISALVEYF